MVEEEADIEETEATWQDDTQTATNVFNEIKSLKIYKRKKRSRYSKEYLIDLQIILSLYPKFHNIIRRCLKIPIGIWSKLKKEVEMIEGGSKMPKCRRSIKPSLSEEQKDFIKTIIKPPTHPQTIDSI